jgi:hypothetical protein
LEFRDAAFNLFDRPIFAGLSEDFPARVVRSRAAVLSLPAVASSGRDPGQLSSSAMRTRDLADSHRACEWPDLAAGIDTPRDLLRDAFDAFNGPLPKTMVEFRALAFTIIDRAVTSGRPEDFAATGASSVEAIVRLLTVMTRDRDPRMRMQAFCYLRLMGLEGRSFQEIGDELGVKRATVHKCYRTIQQRTGLPGRGDKSDAARETFRQLRLGKRRLRVPWAGISLWKSLVCQTPPALAAA